MLSKKPSIFNSVRVFIYIMDLFRLHFGRKGEILEKEIFLVKHASGYQT
jgi:hypothetical protein